MGGPTHSSTPSPHPSYSPDTFHTHPTPLPHTHLPRLSTLPSHLPTHFHTSPHPSHLPSPPPTLTRHLPHTSPNTSPHSPFTLPHNPHTSSNTSPYYPYFIVYLISKFLTFLIFCQISPTIKLTRNSL